MTSSLRTIPSSTEKRRYFVPEVVQTSATDCGPATLKAVLEGFGIPISYGRLREACQTTLDGSSIDTLEDVANLLGLDAQQLLVPADHVLLPALKIAIVGRTGSPTGLFISGCDPSREA